MAKIAPRINKPKMRRSEAEALLAKVPDEFVFYCNDGRVLRDVKELGEALATMSDETYAYHSNEIKKDFGNWVRDIIKDEELAKELEKALTRAEAARAVAGRVAFLSSIR